MYVFQILYIIINKEYMFKNVCILYPIGIEKEYYDLLSCKKNMAAVQTKIPCPQKLPISSKPYRFAGITVNLNSHTCMRSLVST